MSRIKTKTGLASALVLVIACMFYWGKRDWLLPSTGKSSALASKAITARHATAFPAQVQNPTLPATKPSGTSPPIQASPSQAVDPRAHIETAINEAIRVLKARDYATWIKEFGQPNLTDHLSADTIEQIGQLEQVNPSYMMTMDSLLAALQSTAGQTPTLSDNGNTAIFNVTWSGKSALLVLTKGKEGLWYFQSLREVRPWLAPSSSGGPSPRQGRGHQADDDVVGERAHRQTF